MQNDAVTAAFYIGYRSLKPGRRYLGSQVRSRDKARRDLASARASVSGKLEATSRDCILALSFSQPFEAS